MTGPTPGKTHPHDASHHTYDAETGLCDDCGAMVDPVAAPIAAALGPATRAFRLAQDRVSDDDELDDMDVLDVCLTAALRAALVARTPQSAGPVVYRCDQSRHPVGPCSRCELVTSAPLPAVPDGEEKAAFVLPTTTAQTDRKIAIVELRGLTACRCEAAWRDRGLHEPMHGCVHEYREDVDILACAAPRFDGDDVPARLDAAAEALEALHSHGLGYELRQVADQLRDGDGGTPELRAAVAAALALPTETQK